MRYFDREIETLDPGATVSRQLDRLSSFLRDFVAPNPWFKEFYRDVGIDPGHIRSLDEFRQLPMMRKQDILDDVDASPPFGLRSQVVAGDIRQMVETSGTTSVTRERYPLDQADLDAVTEMEMFGFAWAGVGPGVVTASCMPLTTRAGGQWYYEAVRRLQGVYVALATYSAEKKLDYFEALRPQVLVASPSYLRRLEASAVEAGVDLTELGIEVLLTAGEPLSVQWIRQREERWGARVIEQYGSTQRAMAWTCEMGARHGDELGVLHLLPHLTVYEVVDPDTGLEVADGEAGELVITPFASSCAPLVRFATGDRVIKLGFECCPCGRTLPGIRAGSVDRYDTMLKIRGVNVFQSVTDEVLLQAPILEYSGRVYVDPRSGREEIEIAYECERGAELPAHVRDAYVDRLREVVGLRFTLVPHEGPSLMPEIVADSAKRNRWRDERAS